MGSNVAEGECVANLADLYKIIGGRQLAVISEIVAGMEINGRSTVKWAAFRARTGMDNANLNKLLKGLEEKGLICREVDKRGNQISTWDSLWVNPSVLRHAWSRKDFAENQMKVFMAKRGKLTYAKTQPGKEDEHDEGE